MSFRSDITAAEAAGATRQLGEAANSKADGDTPNDFFALWLDRRMIYSCASFHSPNDDLDTAQKRRLDSLCCALRLGPGKRLLDVGCGCGGLVIYAADSSAQTRSASRSAGRRPTWPTSVWRLTPALRLLG
jgi:cyclopropane fatty-acyl-phospholipid synthase-like methyltransferase